MIQDYSLTKEQNESLNKPFPITNVYRQDLVLDGYDVEAVLALTDKQMEKIAASMEEAYGEDGFWDDLQSIADKTYKLKRNN